MMRLPALTAAILIVPAGFTMSRAQIAAQPAATSIRLVDTQGRPVQGATVSTAFQRDTEGQSRFVPRGPLQGKSDARGELAPELLRWPNVYRSGLYAIRYAGADVLVGTYKPTREDLHIVKPITIVMHPACRVRLRVDCPGFREVEQKYHLEPRGDRWRRSASVVLGEDARDGFVLGLWSMTGELEFLLPPGRYLIRVGGDAAGRGGVQVAVGPGHRVRSLGVIDLPVSEGMRRGLFLDHHHLSEADRQGALAVDDLRLRPVRRGTPLRGDPSMTHDLAYSPDGRTLATAHWNNAAPGGVRLWDTSTGELAADLPAPVSTGGVRALAFSPDGRMLAGVVGRFAAPLPPSAVILWDVAARREVRSLHGQGPLIATIAFAPDGRTLATGGEDAIVRFWDVASGREARRFDAGPGPMQSIAYSPDGKTLAIVARFALRLWDVQSHRGRATLENGDFWVNSVTFAPDGRTLAAAGMIAGADRRKSEARVRLYDMTADPPARRAELDARIDGPDFANPADVDVPVSTVAFTRDGRRVLAMQSSAIVAWDAGSGVRQDFIRRESTPSDRLAVAPDGRWIAVTQGHHAHVIDLVPPGP